MIQYLQIFLGRILRSADPFFLPFFVATDAQSKYIIFQKIQFLTGKSGQIRS